jgi:hypothetical protein
MSDSKLYFIELGEDNGPLVPMLRLTRCKECVHSRVHPIEGWLACKRFGVPLPSDDGFCMWGETEEDYADE